MIKVLSLNLEGHRHLTSRILPLLREEKPDVVSFQEVFKADLPLLAERGYHGHFQAMSIMQPNSFFNQSVSGEFGLFLGSKLPITESDFVLYRGDPDLIPTAPKILGKNPKITNFFNRYLGWMTVKADVEFYTVAMTHFTYDPQGEVNQYQREDLKKLLEITAKLPAHLLMGDFNTPRGKELWSRLADLYQDNIPPEIETTIDNQLHRVDQQIKLVVDAFFSQPPYQVESIEVVSGLSDHKGVLATVSR